MRSPELVDMLVSRAAAVMGVDKELLFDTTRRQGRITYARWFVWKVMRSHAFTLKDCAWVFGLKDHTSVIHAMKQIDHDIKHVEFVRDAWERLKNYMNPRPVYKNDVSRAKKCVTLMKQQKTAHTV